MIGRTISHYRITGEIGAGGMGVVYEAEDLTLGRTVALKFLPPELTRDSAARKRFVQEARAASALDHPNICTIHEVDESDGHVFIVMARYQGETLKDRIARGPLEVSEALEIASQISAGIAKSHAGGIVHRDIKPGNIFITDDGGVKILDFGLARLAGETRLTKTGTTVGTVMYMSPEQATGEEVDARSDVWSIGAVLYEMLTGRPPFVGDVDAAIFYQIVNVDPAPVTSVRGEVPLGIENVVDRALTRDPGRRYESAEMFRAAIEEEHDLLKAGLTSGGSATWKRFRRNRRAVVSTGAFAVILVAVVAALILVPDRGAAIDSLAVLPLEPFAGTTIQDTAFADGVTVELITGFSKLEGLNKVISRSSSMRYRGTDKPPDQIGAELGVKALVAGTLRRHGDDVRITAEVLNASSGELIWSDVFEGPVTDILRLQAKIVEAVAGAVAVRLSAEQRTQLAAAREVNPEAYESHQMGMHFLGKESWPPPACAEHFETAIQLDSTFAPAYAGLAEYHIRQGHREAPANARGELAKEYASKALELDPDLGEGYTALGHILWEYDYDMDAAGRAFRKGLELSPSYSYGYIAYSYYLVSLCQFSEAANAAVTAAQLDPAAYFIQFATWEPLVLAGRLDEALERVRRAVDVSEVHRSELPQSIATVYRYANRPDMVLATLDTIPPGRRTTPMLATMTRAYLQVGQKERAVALLDSLESVPDLPSWLRIVLGRLWALAGDPERARVHFERAEADSGIVRGALTLAYGYADIGDFDRAFYWIERLYENRVSWLTRLRAFTEPPSETGSIMKDPRYQEWVQRLHLDA
jgi:TolB-like protein/tetratricopeptide (TPR) repeat protein